jgi:hypothetical protein
MAQTNCLCCRFSALTIAGALVLLLCPPWRHCGFAAPDWTGTAIGGPAAAGSHRGTAETLTITGMGQGPAAKDQLHFVFRPIPAGDVEIVGRITAFDGGPDAQVGLMLRKDSTPAAPMACVSFWRRKLKPREANSPVQNSIGQRLRDPEGLYTHAYDGVAPTRFAPPFWIKLVRVGNDYAAYKSLDGKIWAQVDNNSGGAFRAQGPFQAGVFLSGGAPGKTATATLDHLTIGKPTLPYRTSWVGNSFGQDSTSYVSGALHSLHVAPDGTCYTNAFSDEAGEAGKIYKDGRVLGSLPSRAVGLCYEGGLTGAGDYLYSYGRFGGHIYRMDRKGTEASMKPLVFIDPLCAERKQPTKVATIRGLAAGNGELYVSDAAKNQILVADLRTLKQLPGRSFAFTRPGPLVVDRRGQLWIIQCALEFPRLAHAGQRLAAAVKCFTKDGKFTGREITDLGDPTALAYDAVRDRLLVCDSGPDQNVRIYTGLDQAPRCGATFGVKGGIYAGKRPGLVNDPEAGGQARFYDPNGVGVDKDGNLYVSCGGAGTDLRKYTPDGKMIWAVRGLEGTDNGDFDPDSDGCAIIGPFKQFKMDYSRSAPGSEWSYFAFNWDPRRYGSQPKDNCRSAVVRRLGPQRQLVMFTSRVLNARPVQMFRFDGAIAVPCGRITNDLQKRTCELWLDKNGDGQETPEEVSSSPAPPGCTLESFDVGDNGDVWTVWHSQTKPVIRRFLFQGFDGHGAPTYKLTEGGYEDSPVPEPIIGSWGGMQRIRYDSARDVMYLLGPAKARKEGENLDLVLAGYDGWSKGNRKPRFATALPSPPAQAPFMYEGFEGPEYMRFGYMAMDVAVDKVFVAELWGPIHVYDAQTGKRDLILNAGPEISGLTGWTDVSMGIRACKRKSGEYVILAESAGYRARDILYRWKP